MRSVFPLFAFILLCCSSANAQKSYSFDTQKILGKPRTAVEKVVAVKMAFKSDIKPNTNEMCKGGGEARTYFPTKNDVVEIYYNKKGIAVGADLSGDKVKKFRSSNTPELFKTLHANVSGTPNESTTTFQRWTRSTPRAWLIFSKDSSVERVRLWLP